MPPSRKRIDAQMLRQQAEEALHQTPPERPSLSEAEMQSLVHELRIHQVELELQNEALRQTQRELETARDQYSALYHYAPVAFLSLNADGVIMEANLATARLLGVSKDDLIGQHLITFVALSDRDTLYLHRQKLLEAGTPQTCECRLLRQDGTMFDARLDSLVIPGEDEEAPCWSLALSDIIARKRAEEQLRQSEVRLQGILDNTTAVVYLKDIQSRFLLINRRFATLFQVAQEDVRGKTAEAVLPQQVAEVMRLYDEKVLATATPLESEEAIPLADGRRSYLSHRFPLYAADGTIEAVCGILTDITAHRRAEEELLKMRKIASLGVLAGGIAHDFNNLLTAIMGNISLVKLSADSRNAARLTAAEVACRRATDLTRQLLTFSSGGAPVRRLAHLADLIHEGVDFALHGATVRADISIPDDLWAVEIDPGQIHQVLHNVILNAKQAMPTGGVVQVHTENIPLETSEGLPLSKGCYVKIAIRDQGPGIPAEHLPNIFDPYFTTKARNSGLGLSIAYTIVTKHDGYITVDSSVDTGTTVSIYLPATPNLSVPRSKNVPVSLSHATDKVLLMDDEDIIRELAVEMLTTLGYDIVCACDGNEALTLYQQAREAGQSFAVVILDLTVPGGMGGQETLTHLRALDPHVRAIVSSGYATDPIMATYRQFGFNGVVTKPYTVQELHDVLQRVLSDLPTV